MGKNFGRRMYVNVDYFVGLLCLIKKYDGLKRRPVVRLKVLLKRRPVVRLKVLCNRMERVAWKKNDY